MSVFDTFGRGPISNGLGTSDRGYPWLISSSRVVATSVEEPGVGVMRFDVNTPSPFSSSDGWALSVPFSNFGLLRVLYRWTQNDGAVVGSSPSDIDLPQVSLIMQAGMQPNGVMAGVTYQGGPWYRNQLRRSNGFPFTMKDNPAPLYQDVNLGAKIDIGPFIRGHSAIEHTLIWQELFINNTATRIEGRLWQYGQARPSPPLIFVDESSHTTVPNAMGVIGIGAAPFSGTADVHKLHVYGLWYYSAWTDPYVSPYPVEDTFERSAVYDVAGWGGSTSRHLWVGYASIFPRNSTNFTPAVYTARVFNEAAPAENLATEMVHDVTDSYGQITGSEFAGGGNEDFYYGPKQYLGYAVSGDVRLEATFAFEVSASAGAHLHLGVRYFPDWQAADAWNMRGYWLRVTQGSNSIRFYRKTTTSALISEFTPIGTAATLGTAIAAGTKYRVKIELIGTTLQAKVWQDGTAEPGPWSISTTDATITWSGVAGVNLMNGAAIRQKARLYYFKYAQIFGVNATTLTDGAVLSVTSITGSSATLDAAYTGDNNNNNSATFQIKQAEDAEWITPPGTPSVNRTTKVWTLPVSSLLGNTEYDYKVVFTDADQINGAAIHTASFTTLFTATQELAATVTEVTSDSISLSASYLGDADDDNTIYRSYRVHDSGDPWSSEVALTPNRAAKTAAGTISDLTADVVYDVRIRVEDADGVEGDDEIILATQTISQSVALSSIGVIPQVTSAVVNVFYLHDTNANSTVVMQYRPLTQTLWTTVSDDLIAVDRTAKYFGVTIGGLRPNTTYELRAIIFDPNGVVFGTSDTITGVVTTLGAASQDQAKLKHYLWKVYDSQDNYLGTWHDVSVPEFAIHENGGVSDLAARLHRPITVLNEVAPTIAFQNRIDIWCLDPSSEGFGVNLVTDEEVTLGAYTLGEGWSIDDDGGPDRSAALRFTGTSTTTAMSERIDVAHLTTYVITTYVRCQGRTNLTMRVAEYDPLGELIGTYERTVKNVGQEWQRLLLDYETETDVTSVSIEFVAQPTGVGGSCWVDKVAVRPQQRLIYRGTIESYTTTIDQNGQSIDAQVLGIISQLSDDYIDFLQYVNVQPEKDQGDPERQIPPKPNRGPADPAQMLRDIITIAQQQNKHFKLYYDGESIRNTGTSAEYTFREQMLRAACDKVRELCPPGWHYFVEPDGRVNLRGPEHAVTHNLRIGVEIMNITIEQNIRDLKNVIHVKGRQDEDESEPDGFGSIHYLAFDQESIDKYGKRLFFIRDANITTPDTAQIVGDGRLEEYNRSQQRVMAYVPDVKLLLFGREGLRGYDVERFQPGDFVRIFDPVAGPRNVYWDHFEWDNETWDTTTNFAALPTAVPIKTIQYHGDHVQLELNERQPSGVGDFGRLYRWLQTQDSASAES